MSLLRTFLLWAVMLAVPFQGYAAASMAFCASGSHDPAASAGSAASLPQPDSLPGPDMAHGPHAQDAGTPQSAHAHSHPSSSDSGTAHQCGTCGACHAVALIAAVPAAATHGLLPTVVAEPTVAIAKVAPRVPDKPPRA